LDQGLSLPQIGALVDRDPSTVGYWVQKHGLVANGRAKYAPRGGLTREQLESLINRDLTLAQIAQELGRNVSTVRHWMLKFGLKTAGHRRHRKKFRDATEAGKVKVRAECQRHGSVDFHLRPDGGWRCSRCRSEAVMRRRRRVKQILVEETGGQCQICGYDRCVAALHFHHLDPTKKSFNLSLRGVTRSIAKVRAEAEKCVLLCANCHAEVEAGVTSLEST
jgi:hypothetical protein